MTRYLQFVITSALVAMPFPLCGQAPPPPTVDLASLSCREFLRMGGQERDDVVVFMQGYLSGQRQEKAVNLGALAQSTDKAVDACIDDPRKHLIDAFAATR